MRIIAGSHRGRKLLAPRGRDTRPALDRLRETVFNVLGTRVERTCVLDLFAGVGAFGLEALSRGARRVHFVESSRDALSILHRNVESLGFDAFVSVDAADAFSCPDTDGFDSVGKLIVPPDDPRRAFGVVFVDPPFTLLYEDGGPERVWRRVDELLSPPLAAPDCTLVLRLPSRYRGDLPFTPQDTRVEGSSTVHLLTASPRSEG